MRQPATVEWRKSSRSDPNNCVEVALAWRKSSRTTGNECVEVAWPVEEVAVRDSKNPDGPILVFDRAGFGGFTAGLRRP